MRRIQFIVAALLSIGAGLLAAGCASPDRPAPTMQTSRDLQEITSLYELATAPHAQATRRPVRVQRQRAMHLLAEKAETMAADAAIWDSDIRAIGLTGEEQVRAEAKVQRLRSALDGLHAAADTGDRPALHREYAILKTAYRDLTANVPPSTDR